MRFQPDVATNGIEECPSVGEVAGVDVEALLVSGVAKYRPGYPCLEL